MIVEYIRYQVAQDRAADFEAAYARAAGSLAAAPQCLDYELTRCVDAPDQYILRITWTSADDHTVGFRSGPHFGAFFAQVKPYFTDIQEMRHYERTSVVGAGGSGGAAGLLSA